MCAEREACTMRTATRTVRNGPLLPGSSQCGSVSQLLRLSATILFHHRLRFPCNGSATPSGRAGWTVRHTSAQAGPDRSDTKGQSCRRESVRQRQDRWALRFPAFAATPSSRKGGPAVSYRDLKVAQAGVCPHRLSTALRNEHDWRLRHSNTATGGHELLAGL